MEFKVKSDVITVTNFDTEITLKNLISFNQNTLPEYVKLINFDTNKKPKVIFLEDQLKTIKKEELPEKTKELSKEWNLDAKELALYYLKIKNIKIDDWADIVPIYASINKTDFYNLYSIKTAYNVFNSLFVENSNKLVSQVKKEEEIKAKLAKYTAINTSEFIQDSIIIDYELESSTTDPLDLFNLFKTSKNIPFAYLLWKDQQYYKVYENFTPLDEWFDFGERSTNVMSMFIKKKDGYSYCSLIYENNKILLTIEASIEKGDSDSEIKQLVLDSFSDTTFKVLNRMEKGIKGVFAIPEINISKEIFLDLLTNDPLVSYYMYVDEVRYLSTEKTILYLYYEPLGILGNPLTCFISQKVASRGDIFFANKILPLFTPYLNVRVSRALTLSQIERFKQAFGTILAIYKEKFDSIANEYSNYITGFSVEKNIEKYEKDDTSRLKKLQTKNPELFIYGYPTKCEKTHQPIPIEKNEIKNWKGTRDIIKFPLESEDYYVCPDEAFKHPGLKNNKLQNNEEYKYLLCCYGNEGKPNKVWKQYNEGIDINIESSKASNIVHLKMVIDGKLGYLPRNIYYVLKSDEYLFYRKGVIHDNNSFLHAVLLALDPDYESIENKSEYVKDIRHNLIAGNNDPAEMSVALANVIQQLYYLKGQGEDVLALDLLNDDIVLDSSKYIGLLEAFYKCRIIVFERNDQVPNGDFELSLFTQGLLYNKFDKNKRTVIIYKHKGIRADHLTDYHYELIIAMKDNKEVRYFENTKIITKAGDFFNKKYKLYLLGFGLGSPLDVHNINGLKGQLVDIYGKCRGLLLNNNIFISISPIEPIKNLEIINDQPKDKPNLKVVETFLSKNGFTILKQDIDNKKVKGLLIKIPGIIFSYIAIKSSNIKDNLPTSSNLGQLIGVKDYIDDQDILLQTVKNRKIADFMVQFMLYSFSNYYFNKINTSKYKADQKKWDELTGEEKVMNERNKMFEIATEFLDTKLIIKTDYFNNDIYVPRKITFNNNFFEGDKLIVDSVESQNRIKYYLKYMLTSNSTSVINYKDKEYLDHYYTFPSDFRVFPGEMIFIGNLSIINWIKSRNKEEVYRVVYDLLSSDIKDPYFFSNWKLKNSVPVIIQNVHQGKLENALQVALNYKNEKINTGFNTPGILDTNETAFNVYYFNEGILYTKVVGKSSTPTSELVNLIKYNNGKYAAILYPY